MNSFWIILLEFQIMPLENQMATPRNFLGTCGIMNRGMSAVTILYALLGFAGYLKYGEGVREVITLNLPVHEVLVHIFVWKKKRLLLRRNRFSHLKSDLLMFNLLFHILSRGSQCAKIFIAVAIFFTYGLQFYVCLDLVWNGIKNIFTRNSTFYNYVLRTILVFFSGNYL